MTRRLAILALCILLLLSSCRKSDEKKEDSSFTFTDHRGVEVSVSTTTRTACLTGSLAQIWMLSGGDVCATADDAWVDLGLDLKEDAVNLGKINSISLEKLIASSPDFVIASPNVKADLEVEETLKKMGIPVAYFEVYDFSSYLSILDIFTDITGRKDLYEKYGLSVQEEIEKEIDEGRKDSPSALCLLASTQYLKAKNSDGSVMGAIVRDMGCRNIADTNSTLLDTLSIEYILQENPDYIFITQRGDDEEGMKKFVSHYFDEHPLWKELDAVKEGRVFFLDKKLFNLKPNHRWGEAYAIIGEILKREE